MYRLEIPLPGNPLKAVNSYLIKGRVRNLIIDTGMNREECLEAMRSGLAELEVDLTATDLFITHMHADHSGLISHLATSTSRVYCSKLDADTINYSNDWYDMLSYAYRNGFPPNDEAIKQHPGFKYRNHGWVDFTTVAEGDIIEAADYQFKCIATPGHTQGHLCLYEPNKKILVAGDHILGKITPNISQWTDEGNPLKDFLDSLDKVYDMEIELVLPAHRSLITNHRERITQLQNHHHNRAQAILSILQPGPLNAYEIAPQMKWDMSYKSWDQFPIQQQWFATGEVISHLRYLERKGLVKSDRGKEQIRYSLENVTHIPTSLFS